MRAKIGVPNVRRMAWDQQLQHVFPEAGSRLTTRPVGVVSCQAMGEPGSDKKNQDGDQDG